MRAICLAVVVATAGCYGKAKPPPKRPDIPEIGPDAVASLEVIHENETFVKGVNKGATVKWNARLGGKKYTYGEYRSVVDPEFTNTLNQYDQLYRICKKSLKPAYVGGYFVLGGMLGGIYGLSLKEEADDDKQKKVYIVAGSLIAIGGAIWGGGYLFGGGRSCAQASSMYRNKYLYALDRTTPGAASDLAYEMDQLTKQFNQRRGHATPSE